MKEGYIGRPKISLQQLDKIGDQERFLVRVQSTSGNNGMPFDEFLLSISDTRLAVWKGSTEIEPKEVGVKLATIVVELHGNAAKFTDSYFFSTNNTNSADKLEDVIDQMQHDRQFDLFIDRRSKEGDS